MKARAVSQTAGGTPHGDVHLRRLLLTTFINRQSNVVFLRCRVLISPDEVTRDVCADRMDFYCEDSGCSMDVLGAF